MSKRAKQKALEAYPPTFTSGKRYAKRVQSEKVDTHAPIRSIFINGYEQAEKDLALTWEDIQTIDNIVVDMACNTDWPLRGQEVFYTEVLNRFNKSKEERK